MAVDPEENLRKWRISRRRFLEIVGVGGAASAVAAVIPGLTQLPPGNGRQLKEENQKPRRRQRKWMMIIDLRRCDGCQSVNLPPQCTEACNISHFLPEPMQWIEVYEHDLDTEKKLHEESGGAQGLARRGTRFVPTPCMQCQNPPCVNVCPVGATWSTPEGPVLIDQDRCIGCRMCMAACPYERRFFTWGTPSIPPEALFVEPSPEHMIPTQKGIVAKCDFCPEIARSGRLPFCITACPHRALYYGDLEEDLATNGEEVVKITQYLSENSAFRYKEELGTRPRVYYIPGHGELVGRDPREGGRLPVRWKYKQTLEGAKEWQRSKR